MGGGGFLCHIQTTVKVTDRDQPMQLWWVSDWKKGKLVPDRKGYTPGGKRGLSWKSVGNAKVVLVGSSEEIVLVNVRKIQIPLKKRGGETSVGGDRF